MNTKEFEEERYIRNTPINELDMQLMIVDSEWGKEIAPELKQRLIEVGDNVTQDKDGKLKIENKQLWGLFTYYTRDMRLGNIDKESFAVCSQWLNFAGDCLRENYVNSFLIALSRVITILELSQSRGGFLRKQLSTRTNVSYSEFSEKNDKKGLFNHKSNGGN